MKQYAVLLIVFVILTLSVLTSCVEAPNSVGSEVLPSSDSPVLQVDTIFATYHETKHFFSNNSLLNMFCVGRYQSYEAWGLLAFYNFPDTFANISVKSASLRLKACYHFGDSATTLSFRAHRLKKAWFSDSLTLDSLKFFPSEYYDTSTPLSLTFSQALGDTDYVYIDIPDTQMVRLWLQTEHDSLPYNYGLLLEPTNSTIIMGFSSYYALDTSATPLLIVEYEKNGIPYTFIHQTSTTRYLASAPNPALANSSLIYAQNGIPYRTIVQFDVSSIPNPSIINSATLTFTLNPAYSHFSTYHSDSILVSQVNVDGSLSFPWISISTVTTDTFGNRLYSVDLRTAVTSWVRNRYPAHIVVMGYGESASFTRFAFYGPDAPTALKPRITIVYTTR